MYSKGWGVTPDSKEAAKWWRRAAEQGEAVSQYNLGLMYEQGRRIRQDKNEAIKWYRKSAKQGNKDAQKKLEQLGESW